MNEVSVASVIITANLTFLCLLLLSTPENPLSLSWCDRTWLSILNPQNVLNYFAERSNPFYDHTCNNEMLRMRGIRMDAIQELEKMQGIEYVLLHVQEPILYVIRKQKRHSPTATTPIANYYIIAGVVYQAPDLQSIIQSKMLTAIHYLQSAFDECFQYARFHPSTDYYWNFSKDGASSTSPGGNGATTGDDRNGKDSSKSSSNKDDNTANKKKEISIAEASDQARHMYRVDVLIHELVKKFPPKIVTPSVGANGDQQADGSGGGGDNAAENGNINGVKTEPGTSDSTTTATNGAGSNAMDTSTGEDDQKGNKSGQQMTPPAKKPKLTL